MSGIKLAFKLRKIPKKWLVDALVGLGSPLLRNQIYRD